jgi:hypothetical protein
MSIKLKLLLVIAMISIAYFGRAFWLETYAYGNNSEAHKIKLNSTSVLVKSCSPGKNLKLYTI